MLLHVGNDFFDALIVIVNNLGQGRRNIGRLDLTEFG